jgi:succinate dehydrogenase/fumarate reductase cytochrome b subunit
MSIKTAITHSRACKGLALLIILFLFATILHAQVANGDAGLQAATDNVKKYFKAGCTLLYAIGAFVGLIGAIKVFNKWNAGEQDTAKTAAAWFSSCIFLVVVAAVLSGFFGVQ